MSGFEKLQSRLGYQFKEEALLSQALTHRSYSAKNNERLEFLGDSILNFLIAEILFSRFKSAREGQLSRLRSKMVRRQTLAEIARELDLGDHLIMGGGELKSGGYLRDSVLSDTLEAIIGAIHLDADLEIVRDCLNRWYSNRISDLSLEKSFKDAKSRLQEFLQSKKEDLPTYRVVKTEGQSHDQIFYVDCQCALLDDPAQGEGSSRRIAEQNAASAALLDLGLDPDHG